jgi:hypothetical protein
MMNQAGACPDEFYLTNYFSDFKCGENSGKEYSVSESHAFKELIMKRIDDTRLYLFFSIVTLFVALILGLVSYYSIMFVEPEIEKLMIANDNVGDNYRKAFEMLKDPQIFARYENFDRDTHGVRENVLPYFENKVKNSEAFVPEDKIYLNVLFERRKQGSALGRNTMVFFLLLTLMGMGFFIYEKRSLKTAG